MLERFQRSAIGLNPRQSAKSAMIRVLFVDPPRRPRRPSIPKKFSKLPYRKWPRDLLGWLRRAFSSEVVKLPRLLW